MSAAGCTAEKTTLRASRIHVLLGASVLLMLVLGFAGCAFTQIHLASLRSAMPSDLAIAAMLSLPVAYAHHKGYDRIRDSICFVFWAKIISLAIIPCVLFAARFNQPLQDEHLAAIDRAMGVNIGAVHAWSSAHKAIGGVIDSTYPRLTAYLLLAILLPIAFKRSRTVEIFFIANVVGLLLMLPFFAFVPAIGPWSVYHFAPSIWQTECERGVLALRASGPITNGFAGVVAFPSLHVFWAAVCADALSCIRWLRIPAATFSALIILSTMTLGWHYFTDVLGGLLLAIPLDRCRAFHN